MVYTQTASFDEMRLSNDDSSSYVSRNRDTSMRLNDKTEDELPL